MPSAAFFDLDGTLLCGESQLSFLLWCLRRGVVRRLRALPVLARYSSYLTGFSRDALKLRESGFGLLRDIPMVRIEESAKEFFRSDLAARFRRQAISLIEAHGQQGYITVLVTSACQSVACPVADKLGVDALVATRLTANNGICTGERVLPEPYGAGKRILVEKFCAEHDVSPDESFAYTDHHSDVPLLEAIGHPVVVNPTRKLRSIAAARGWRVLNLDAAKLPDLALTETRFQC